MINSLAFVANNAEDAAQACLDALYCSQKLSSTMSHYKVIYSYTEKAGINALNSEQLGFLHNLGIDIQGLIKQCHGRFHFSDKVSIKLSPLGNSESSNGNVSWCSMATMGVAMQGVDFHHLLSKMRNNNQEIDATLATYSLNSQCQIHNKQALPIADPRDIRSTLKTVLYVNSDELFEYLKTFLTQCESKIVPQIMFIQTDVNTNFYLSQSDPKLPQELNRQYLQGLAQQQQSYLSAVGEPEHTADFFFDYRISAQQMPYHQYMLELQEHNALRTGIYITHNNKHSAKHNDKHNTSQSSLCRLRSTANRTQVTSFFDNEQDVLTCFGNMQTDSYVKNNTKSIIKSISTLHDSITKEPLKNNPKDNPETEHSVHIQSNMWIGNQLLIGQLTQYKNIACSLPDNPNHMVFDHWINNVPSNNTMGIVRSLANEQFTQLFGNLACFALFGLYVHDNEHPQVLKSSIIAAQLRERLKLFGKTGTQYTSEFDPIDRSLWFNFMLACNVWPSEYDIVAENISDSASIVSKLVNKVSQAAQKLPST